MRKILITLTAIVLTTANAARAEGGLYDTHPQKLPDFSSEKDCKGLQDELTKLKTFAQKPDATPKQLKANQARTEKLQTKYDKLNCAKTAGK